MAAPLEFRRVTADDLPVIHEWLQREHVRRWWSERETYEQVVEHYLPAIEGREKTDHYLIVLRGRPIGFIETYLVADYPDYAEQVEVGDSVAGVDLFIADEHLTGKGLGTEVIRAFVRGVVFARPATVACIAGPDVRNVASIRAFEKAGFRRVREFLEDGQTHALVRLERSH